MWVGTLGMPTDSLTEITRDLIGETLRDDYESLTVFVGDSEFEGHYTHFCHSVLWPALHYQMQESPRHTEYDDYSWKQYLKVNEIFADTIASHWQPGDRIWVHDYHLLALPALLRKRLPHAEIGFFLHTAFPSSEVFRCLNSRDALLDGLLGADLIGFQTEEYRNHFLHSCSRLRRLEVSVDGVQVNDRFVYVKNCPLGIDYKSLNVLRQSVEVKDWIANISERYKGKHLIVARDRLDAPGGIKQKLRAYELFLEKYPKWRGNVSRSGPVHLLCERLMHYLLSRWFLFKWYRRDQRYLNWHRRCPNSQCESTQSIRLSLTSHWCSCSKTSAILSSSLYSVWPRYSWPPTSARA